MTKPKILAKYRTRVHTKVGYSYKCRLPRKLRKPRLDPVYIHVLDFKTIAVTCLPKNDKWPAVIYDRYVYARRGHEWIRFKPRKDTFILEVSEMRALIVDRCGSIRPAPESLILIDKGDHGERSEVYQYDCDIDAWSLYVPESDCDRTDQIIAAMTDNGGSATLMLGGLIDANGTPIEDIGDEDPVDDEDDGPAPPAEPTDPIIDMLGL